MLCFQRETELSTCLHSATAITYFECKCYLESYVAQMNFIAHCWKHTSVLPRQSLFPLYFVRLFDYIKQSFFRMFVTLTFKQTVTKHLHL